eukprot:6202867-Pleurochrysis_carterae.AAC.5
MAAAATAAVASSLPARYDARQYRAQAHRMRCEAPTLCKFRAKLFPPKSSMQHLCVRQSAASTCILCSIEG